MEFVVNIFTHNGKGGNKAGVVMLKEDILKDECQKKLKSWDFQRQFL